MGLLKVTKFKEILVAFNIEEMLLMKKIIDKELLVRYKEIEDRQRKE